MTPWQLITIGFIGLGTAAGAFTIVGASLYDLVMASRNRNLTRRPNAGRLQKPPLLSVLVLAHNAASTIEQCLDSLAGNSARKYEVIVINSGSTDNAKELVTSFIWSHPKKSIYLTTPKKPGQKAAIASGLRRSSGELILVIDADNLLVPSTLKNLIRPFCLDENLNILLAHKRTVSQPTLASLTQQFEDIARSQVDKLGHLIGLTHVAGSTGVVYRRRVFTSLIKADAWLNNHALAAFGIKKLQASYASDAVIYTQPARSYIGLFRQKYLKRFDNMAVFFRHRHLFNDNSKHIRLFMSLNVLVKGAEELAQLFVPIMLSYFMFLAISHRTAYLFGLSWAAVSVFLLLAIWGDDRLRFIQKIKLGLLVPLAYGLFYGLSLGQFMMVLKFLVHAIKSAGSKLLASISQLLVERRLKTTAKV